METRFDRPPEWWVGFWIIMGAFTDEYRDNIEAGYRRSMHAYDRLFLAVNR